MDAVLLARFAAETPVATAVDLGCGCGVIALCMLALGGARKVVGIDLQEEMVGRAARAAEANGWGTAASFVGADLRQVPSQWTNGEYALALTNPPYRPEGTGRISAEPAVALARHEVACTLETVTRAAGHLLARDGQFCVVYPAYRLAHLIIGCRGEGLEPKVLRLVHPRQGQEAKLALLRCVKGAREGIQVRPPLYLHEGDGYSEEARRLLGSS